MGQLYHEVASGVDPILFVVDSASYLVGRADLGLDTTVIYPDDD